MPVVPSGFRMKFVFALYVVTFAVLCMWAVQRELELPVPRWKPVLTTLACALGTAGMATSLIGSTEGLAPAWRWVFPFLVVQLVLSLLWDLRHGREVMQEAGWIEEGEGEVDRSRFWLGIALGLAFHTPYLIANWQVAYG